MIMFYLAKNDHRLVTCISSKTDYHAGPVPVAGAVAVAVPVAVPTVTVPVPVPIPALLLALLRRPVRPRGEALLVARPLGPLGPGALHDLRGHG